MSYTVKEIFSTLQGEGANSGRAVILCRFSGCNLWSGLEVDREHALCRFCDTDFTGTDGLRGGVYKTASDLSDEVEACRSKGSPSSKWVLCTGGEPLLQLDTGLIEEFHKRNFLISLETNGTFRVPDGIDWITVSPKAGTDLVQRSGDELKLVWPQKGIDPEDCIGMDFRNYYLQPIDGDSYRSNLNETISYCLAHPEWMLSIQIHKYMDIR